MARQPPGGSRVQDPAQSCRPATRRAPGPPWTRRCSCLTARMRRGTRTRPAWREARPLAWN